MLKDSRKMGRTAGTNHRRNENAGHKGTGHKFRLLLHIFHLGIYFLVLKNFAWKKSSRVPSGKDWTWRERFTKRSITQTSAIPAEISVYAWIKVYTNTFTSLSAPRFTLPLSSPFSLLPPLPSLPPRNIHVELPSIHSKKDFTQSPLLQGYGFSYGHIIFLTIQSYVDPTHAPFGHLLQNKKEKSIKKKIIKRKKQKGIKKKIKGGRNSLLRPYLIGFP